MENFIQDSSSVETDNTSYIESLLAEKKRKESDNERDRFSELLEMKAKREKEEQAQKSKKEYEQAGPIDKLMMSTFPTASKMEVTGVGSGLKKGALGLLELTELPERFGGKIFTGQPLYEPGGYALKNKTEKFLNNVQPQIVQYHKLLDGLEADETKLKEYGFNKDDINTARKALNQYDDGIRIISRTISDPTIAVSGVKSVVKGSLNKLAKLKKPLSNILYKLDPKVIDPIIKTGQKIKGFGKELGQSANIKRRFLDAASQKQNIPADVLEGYGLGIGKEARKIRAAAKSSEQVVDEVFNFGFKHRNMLDYNKKMIQRVLDQEIPLYHTKKLTNSLYESANDLAKKYNKTESSSINTIRNLAKDLQGRVTKRKRGVVTGGELVDINNKISDMIKKAENNNNEYLLNSLIKVKNQIKDDVGLVPNSSSSALLDRSEKLKYLLDEFGRDPVAGKKKIKTVLEGSDNEKRKEMIDAINLFNYGSLREHSDYLKKADYFGPTGRPKLLSEKEFGFLKPLAVYTSPLLTTKAVGAVNAVENLIKAGFKNRFLGPAAKTFTIEKIISELTKPQQNKVILLSEKYANTKDPKRKALIERNLNKYLRSK